MVGFSKLSVCREDWRQNLHLLEEGFPRTSASNRATITLFDKKGGFKRTCIKGKIFQKTYHKIILLFLE
jgi:hypothetical protein